MKRPQFTSLGKVGLPSRLLSVRVACCVLSPIGILLFAATAPATPFGWAVGDAGTIINTTNGGVSWTSQTSGTTNALRDVQFVDTSNGWAVGDGGVILHTSNGGAN
jgi:photosystem II stability/assembly factor-like uncharacterized protein